jgi:hypothetical protein
MLPKNVTDLMDGFVRVYDSKQPTEFEFQKAQNKGASEHQRTGMGYGNGQGTVYITRELKDYLEKRANYIWGKMQEAMNAASIDAYPELSNDLKSKFSEYHTPTLNRTFQFIEKFQVMSKENPAVFGHNKNQFYNILLHVNAEIDLFSVNSVMKASKKKTSTRIKILGDNNTVQSGNNNRQSVANEKSNVDPNSNWMLWLTVIGTILAAIGVLIAWMEYNKDHFYRN